MKMYQYFKREWMPGRRVFRGAWAVLALAASFGLAILDRPAFGEPISPLPTVSEQAGTGPCVPSATKLCVNGDRFEVTAAWTTPDGQSGSGQAVALTVDTGYFWFFSSSNVEVVLKVLDACGFNGRFWVFAGGLTNVKVDLFVRDTRTGTLKIYHNPQGTAFQPIEDVNAFTGCARASDSKPDNAAGAPTGTVLSVGQNRFQVTANWRTPDGQTGAGQAVQLTDETGYFWFFSPSNVEMVIKVLNACSFNNFFWVFAGGLTNVQVDITVLDTTTGATKTYHNPQNTAFQPIQDTSALSCSPTGLPPDPGAAGKVTLGGIDSDHDGIRDDLQRYIVLTYGGSQPTVDALKKTAKVLQGAILDSTSQTSSIDHATDLARATECLQALRPGDAQQVQEALVAQALNTEARGLAYLDFNDRLGGAAFPLSPPDQWPSSCNAPPAAALRAIGIATPGVAAKSCEQNKKATIFFGNGVFNTCAEAQQSTAYLAQSVKPLLSADEQATVTFATACNPTRGHFADVWRAFKQSVSSEFSSFYRFMAGLDPVPDVLQQKLQAEAAQLTADAVVDDPTLQSHVELYKSLLFEGQKVLVTAHSQGNFYANLASDALAIDPSASQDWPSFGIVSVANPDNRVGNLFLGDDPPYTTFVNDLIMAAIRPITGALPGNAGINLHVIDDFSSHQFLKSYMRPGSSSQARILGEVHDVLEALPSPSNGSGNGVITVTLTWEHETDIDLHVFEPDGTHVFYANKVGDSGFLDRDNTTGFGPEHYYVACDTLQTGTYHIGVNYYNGIDPESVHIQVAAGLQARSFDLVLPTPLGPDGNDSPQPVADIIVTGNATTGYTFEVQQRF